MLLQRKCELAESTLKQNEFLGKTLCIGELTKTLSIVQGKIVHNPRSKERPLKKEILGSFLE